jgi:hypothetical protein
MVKYVNKLQEIATHAHAQVSLQTTRMKHELCHFESDEKKSVIFALQHGFV